MAASAAIRPVIFKGKKIETVELAERQPGLRNSAFLSQCRNRRTKPGKSRRNCVAMNLELPR
jgi:hypothetical protein